MACVGLVVPAILSKLIVSTTLLVLPTTKSSYIFLAMNSIPPIEDTEFMPFTKVTTPEINPDYDKVGVIHNRVRSRDVCDISRNGRYTVN